MKTPNTDALLPCPFCGGDMVMQKSVKAKDARYSVRCVEQGCIMHGGSYPISGGKKSAIALANTRTPQPSVTSEELAKIVKSRLGRCPHESDDEYSLRVAQAILTAFHVSKKE